MKRLLCYAHFDEKGELKPFVKDSLRKMKEICDVTAFVSNSPLSDADLEYLNSECGFVKVNDNVGYDFYMWKTALGAIDYKAFDEVVLMNSSIFGPISDIKPLISEMTGRHSDFWGITECFQMEPHIQSYFFVFRKRVIESEAFALFWKSVIPFKNKHQVVLNYELGLSQWLMECGFKAEVCFNFVNISENCKTRIKDNPSVEHAVELLKMGNPFLKVETIKKNRIEISMIRDILDANGYPVEYLDVGATKIENLCPICGSAGKLYYRNMKDRLNLYNTGRYTYYKCKNGSCGVLWIYPVPNETDMELIYRNYYTNVPSSPSRVRDTDRSELPKKFAAEILKLINKLLKIHRKRNSYYLHGLDKVKPGKLLEVGCGSGDRLVKLCKLGWEVTGQEIDGNVWAALREKNITVIEGTLESNKLDANQFDAILLSHVIEHVRNPIELLSECYRLLKPGGNIYLSTPNLGSLTHFLLKKYWLGLDAPRHLIVYTQNALTDIIRSSGYKDVNSTTISLNTELFAMHSIDIMVNKWTYMLSGPRLGKEVIPLSLQLVVYLVNGVTGKFGDECFVVASK
ncbi:MAG: methyltransferase domain-containing protein [Sulfurimonas sp.]|nr:methyltransferase domain-containing protein [Sulfurimonas sp.]